MTESRVKKEKYGKKLARLFDEYEKVFVIRVDMVGSKQIQTVRQSLRGVGDMLFGKNTLIRKLLRLRSVTRPKLASLLPYVSGNTGFLFVNGDTDNVRKILKANFFGASARPGVIAPIDVFVPAGVTSLQPTETSFFQALNIPTKITKGAVEILSDVHLIKSGAKVLPGQSALLQKLSIKPFTYGPEIVCYYEDGVVFSPQVLDIDLQTLSGDFIAGVQQVAAVSLAADYPTLAAVPHCIINGYKNVLSIALATDYCFPLAKKVKDILDNPEALAAMLAASTAAATPAATTTSAPEATKAAAPAPAAVEEEEEEEVEFDLFD